MRLLTPVWRFGLSILGLLPLTATVALAQPFELGVKKDRFFGSSEGTLVFGTADVIYETDDTNDARRWTYEDVKQVQVLAPTRIVIKTFEDQGWTRFGADRSVEFEVTDGAASTDLVAFLLQRVEHPMVSAVVPALDGPPDFLVPVKLRRRLQGSHGALALYDAGLVYETDHSEHGRIWRPIDLRMVFQPDRHRLDVDVYEGGADSTKTFSFDLKAPLPTGFLDAVWGRIHGPSMPRIGEREALH